MVQGMITIASTGLDPLANGAFMLLSPCATTPSGESQSPRKLLFNHHAPVIADDQMHLVIALRERIEQTLGVHDPAGAGDGN